MKVIIYGYAGKMGTHVQEAVAASSQFEIAAMADAYGVNDAEKHTYQNLNEVTEKADVLIDFSNHVCTKEVLDYCMEHQLPAVICTTGHSEEEKAMIHAAAEKTAVFYAANMSLGVAVLADIAKRAAAMFPDADIEIVEKHHNRKLDAPSGTALFLADEIRSVREEAVYNIGRHEYGKRQKNEIGITAVRMGNEVGTHEIYINTGKECLVLTHQAQTRALFADGALKAAEYLAGKSAGIYTMRELTGGK